mmetsp:Transcript_41530/g.124129  ORF Transcript_41530/g.124129 Transcript_41530/m.124129 type:complete len:283 (-) Transcript_41530:279-1127(-)
MAPAAMLEAPSTWVDTIVVSRPRSSGRSRARASDCKISCSAAGSSSSASAGRSRATRCSMRSSGDGQCVSSAPARPATHASYAAVCSPATPALESRTARPAACRSAGARHRLASRRSAGVGDSRLPPLGEVTPFASPSGLVWAGGPASSWALPSRGASGDDWVEKTASVMAGGWLAGRASNAAAPCGVASRLLSVASARSTTCGSPSARHMSRPRSTAGSSRCNPWVAAGGARGPSPGSACPCRAVVGSVLPAAFASIRPPARPARLASPRSAASATRRRAT